MRPEGYEHRCPRSAPPPFLMITEIIGNRNAAVLPDPVWAHAMMSCPEQRIGSACFCTGVGTTYPAREMLSLIGCARSSASWKVSMTGIPICSIVGTHSTGMSSYLSKAMPVAFLEDSKSFSISASSRELFPLRAPLPPPLPQRSPPKSRPPRADALVEPPPPPPPQRSPPKSRPPPPRSPPPRSPPPPPPHPPPRSPPPRSPPYPPPPRSPPPRSPPPPHPPPRSPPPRSPPPRSSPPPPPPPPGPPQPPQGGPPQGGHHPCP
mmetsp:Transcript_13552/g.32928  ORF Transcript_13552/g.32928 Transcript_13552/m.32928 type:complete len:264 (-) Transcript_13552:1314-2105(-)